MYLVLELQTVNNTMTAVPPIAYATLPEAFQAYYTALAAAAVSSITIHTVMILDPTGVIIRVETFDRRQPEYVAEE